MRTLAARLVTCVAVVGVTATAVAQETASGPPWWQGDRAEVAEHGFALTVPAGWVAFDLTGGLQRQASTVATVLELTDKAAEGYLKTLRGVRDGGALLLLTTDDANCEFRVDPALGPGHAEALAGYRYDDASDDDDILMVERPREVTLASGPAYLMTWTSADGNPELSMFLGQRQDLLVEIKCSGQSRPDDDWLSVAGGFEWLTADGAIDQGDGTSDASPMPAGSTGVLAGPPFPDRVEGTGVYDQADVFGPFTLGVADQVIREVAEATGSQIVVYTQVKPEADTFEEAAADAAALMDEWGLEPDGLVILFDLDSGRCHGQVQLYASDGYAARHLSNAERQKLFDEVIVPPLEECDFDTALLGTMSRIGATADAVESIDETTPAAQRATQSLYPAVDDIYPEELGDGAFVADDVNVFRTEEEVVDFFFGTEPDDSEVERIRQVAERAGGSVDDMTMVDGWFDLEDGTPAVSLDAIQVRGVETDLLRDSVHALAMAMLDDPAYSEERIAGKRVTVYDTLETFDRINFLYAYDDVAWVFATYEEYAEDVLESLPG